MKLRTHLFLRSGASIFALALLLIGGAMFAPVAAEDLRIEFDPDVDFTTYRTYSWAQRPERTGKNPLREGAQMDLTIRGAVDDVLAGRGLRLTEETDGSTDLVLTYEAATADEFFTDEVRKGGGRVKWQTSGDMITTRTTQTGMIVLEVSEGGEEGLIWSGMGRIKLKSEMPVFDGPKLRQKAEKLATKIARRFPPKQ